MFVEIKGKLEKLENVNVEIDEKSITEAKELKSKIEPFYPCYIVFYVIEYDGKLHHHNSIFKIMMDYNNLSYVIRYDSYRKKYSIFCSSINELKNIENYDVNRTAEEYKKPNNIGVLTSKKILDWLKYYESIYNDLKKLNNEHKSKIEKFLKSIENEKVRWYNNNKSGTIEKNGIVMEFTISNNYVGVQLKIDYKVDNTYESFLKLANNKINEN